ncbi:MAG: LamG domain-containing protein [Opitutus sp.]|nr:LamG domain-containing protein [Opitutus sp.]
MAFRKGHRATMATPATMHAPSSVALFSPARGGEIVWSQPEIVLYADEIAEISGPISYPGFLEADGRYFISETSKVRAGVHQINPDLLQQVWSQHERREVTRKGLKAEVGPDELSRGRPDLKFPAIPDMVRHQGGFTIDLWMEWTDLSPGQVILDNRDSRGRGVLLHTNLDGTLEITMGDGKVINAWTADRNALQARKRHHVVVVADSGPKIIMFIVDGILCDGGSEREFGWGRFSPFFQTSDSDTPLRLAPNFHGRLINIRLYNRAMTVSEAIGNFRAGPPPSLP